MTHCLNCQEGKSGAYITPPHPIIKCSVDHHGAIQILDTKHTVKTLMEKCPLGHEVVEEEFEEEQYQ